MGVFPGPRAQTVISSTELKPCNLDLDSGTIRQLHANALSSLALISPLIQRGMGLITPMTTPQQILLETLIQVWKSTFLLQRGALGQGMVRVQGLECQ